MTIKIQWKSVLKIVILLAGVSQGIPARAQNVDSELSVSCVSSCPQEISGLCHFAVGMFMLKGAQQGLPDCISKSIVAIHREESVNTIRGGIAELDIALQNSKGLQVSNEDLRIIKAGAFVALSRQYMRLGNNNQSEEALLKARSIYQDLLNQTSKLNKGSLVKISAGLIRAGSPAESLVALQRLPSNDPDREYMNAEALFKIGDRQGAAKEYSRWIASKCKSSPIVFSSDEYGEPQWAYLQRTDSRPNRCENLPQELRSRLEILKMETPYLKNLPKANDAPVQIPDVAH